MNRFIIIRMTRALARTHTRTRTLYEKSCYAFERSGKFKISKIYDFQHTAAEEESEKIENSVGNFRQMRSSHRESHMSPQ